MPRRATHHIIIVTIIRTRQPHHGSASWLYHAISGYRRRACYRRTCHHANAVTVVWLGRHCFTRYWLTRHRHDNNNISSPSRHATASLFGHHYC